MTSGGSSRGLLTSSSLSAHHMKDNGVRYGNHNSKRPSSSTSSSSISSLSSSTSSVAVMKEEEKEIDYKTVGDVKPPYSYASLICMAMKTNKHKMTLSSIYKWIKENYLYYRNADPSWQVKRTNLWIDFIFFHFSLCRISRSATHTQNGDREISRVVVQQTFLFPLCKLKSYLYSIVYVSIDWERIREIARANGKTFVCLCFAWFFFFYIARDLHLPLRMGRGRARLAAPAILISLQCNFKLLNNLHRWPQRPVSQRVGREWSMWIFVCQKVPTVSEIPPLKLRGRQVRVCVLLLTL